MKRLRLIDVIPRALYGYRGSKGYCPGTFECTKSPGWKRGYVHLRYDAAKDNHNITHVQFTHVVGGSFAVPVKYIQGEWLFDHPIVKLADLEYSLKRTDFEHWVVQRRTKFALVRDRADITRYGNQDVQLLWELWQEKTK